MKDLRDTLELLFSGKALDAQSACEVFREMATGNSVPAQTAALLAVYRTRLPAVAELRGFREALLELALPIELGDLEAVDLCGTGGDSRGTFNISTVSAFVVAGAGATVVKHGNYGASSHCGSSNLLEALGVFLPQTADEVRHSVERSGVAFLHAPYFHPVLKNVAPLRRDLGVRTVFNLLGPLVNPARPAAQLIGVYPESVLPLFAGVLAGVRYSIVASLDGYDEVSLTAPFRLIRPESDEIISPSALPLPAVAPDELIGGSSVAEATQIALGILRGAGSPAQEAVVLVNSALALDTFYGTADLAECIDRASESLRSGRALSALEQLQELRS